MLRRRRKAFGLDRSFGGCAWRPRPGSVCIPREPSCRGKIHRQYAVRTRSCCHQASRQPSSLICQLFIQLAKFRVAYLQNRKGLDVTGGRNVGSSAQIDKGTTSVDSTLGAIGDSLLDEILLVFAVVEHLKKFLLGHFETLERLLLLDDAVGKLLESLLVLFSDRLAVDLLAYKQRPGTNTQRTLPCWPYRSRIQEDPL